jgi:protein-S-isoprenylcysteine O-methyltransferase Ste14/RimJ/RimL family protein N-acetyltransferase
MESTDLDRRHRVAGLLMTSYGVVVYAGFLALLVGVIAFVEGLPLPRGIDDGPTAPTAVAAAVDLALLALFAVQHSVMARSWFKRWWTRVVPQPIERSTYVLFSSVVLALLVWQWRSLPGTVWSVGGQPWRFAIGAVSFAGWALALGSTFLIDHLDMFGLRQVVRHQRGLPETSPPFQTRLLYRVVRHPLLLGMLIAFWAAPTMSWGRLLFAGAATGYIVLGVWFEERDLVAHYGDRYRRYRREVPMLVPGIGNSLDEGTGTRVRTAPEERRAGRDAGQVRVREIVPADEESLRAFYRGLSQSTLRKRFLTPYPSLPESMLRQLALTGRPDRYVIVATHDDAIVGEARFHRVPGSDSAEVAVVIADHWQRRGLGSELAGRLVREARARGLSAFTGSMRADNGAAAGLLASLAPAADRRVRSGELEFQAPLPAPLRSVAEPCAGIRRPGATTRADRAPATNSATSRPHASRAGGRRT